MWLMIAALPLKEMVTYHDLLEKIVCSIDSKLCMLHQCDECPGTYGLQQYLKSKPEDAILQDEVVNFKYWISTDRTTLEERTKHITEFMEILIQEIDQLTIHHYIAKN